MVGAGMPSVKLLEKLDAEGGRLEKGWCVCLGFFRPPRPWQEPKSQIRNAEG